MLPSYKIEIGSGDNPRYRILVSVLRQGDMRPRAQFGVLAGLRVQLSNGLSAPDNGPTSSTAASSSYSFPDPLQQSCASYFGVGQNPMNHSQELEPPPNSGRFSQASHHKRCLRVLTHVPSNSCIPWGRSKCHRRAADYPGSVSTLDEHDEAAADTGGFAPGTIARCPRAKGSGIKPRRLNRWVKSASRCTTAKARKRERCISRDGAGGSICRMPKAV